MKKLFFLLIYTLFISATSMAQSQLMLYQLNSRLPQSNMINPGFFPDYKFTVGLPVLSSTYVSANGGKLSFDNAFTRSADDSLHFNPQKLADNLDENNRLEINSNVQLFYLGLKVNKNYFSLSLNERVEAGITYPKTFVQLLAAGNGAYEGQLLAFDGLGFRAQAYHELAAGYGRDITDKLSIGVRAKFLSGVAGIDVENISAGLLTSTDSLYLYSSAFNINMAGYDLIDDSGDIFQSATAFKNIGFALDVGAHYWISDKLRVSMAVNDLGVINWDNGTRQLQFDEVKYSFKGIDFIDVLDQNSDPDLLTQEIDSLQELFEPEKVDGIGYKTKLAPKFYAGGSYHLGKHHTFGATFYGDVFKGTFKPAFGLSYNLQLGHIWTIGINASYRNSSFSNIGIGTTLTLGPIQLYALTENVTALTRPSDARVIDARIGMNLVFGKLNKPKKKPRQQKNLEPEPSVLLTAAALTEPITTAIIGTADDELALGFYIVIAGFDSQEEADTYNLKLVDEGYAALSGYQSERGQYYTYLMYSPDDGNKAINKKNDLKDSFAAGLEIPWVLWVKEKE
jgi:hypothetical protein